MPKATVKPKGQFLPCPMASISCLNPGGSFVHFVYFSSDMIALPRSLNDGS